MTGIRRFSWLLASIVLFFPLHAAWSANFSIELDEETLQSQLDTMFPVTREEPLVKLSMLQPQVMLSPENERIGLRLTLLATFPNDTDMTGETVVDGTLRYDITTTALYLDDPEIRFLEIDGIAPAVTREIRTMANGILATYLRSTPIHVLNQKGTASGSSARLKNVRVQQGKLVLDLGS